jgi:hypothetical protein
MQAATLTFHAAKRLNQRCTLTPKQFKRMLDDRATVQLSQQRGGRLVHRLFYSIQDNAWFVGVQDDSDGDVLTTLPLAYFENFHGPVSGLNRRRARKLAREIESSKLEQQRIELAARAEREAAKAKALDAQASAAAGWRVSVQFHNDGKTMYKNLGRTLPEHGEPRTWVEGHPIHLWFRERLDTLYISVFTLQGVWLEQGKNQACGELLLEYLVLSEQEILHFKWTKTTYSITSPTD